MIDKEKYKSQGIENIVTYQPYFQEKFVRSNVDFVVGGAAMGIGKSFAALLMAAEPVLDPDFRMVYIRKNIQDTKSGGSGTDEIQRIYGNLVNVKLSENPRATFPSGAFIDFTHMSDQTPDKVLERIRGWQYSVIYFDEGTGFEWSTIRLAFSRNRGAGKWNGKVRITCNPKKNHWLRKWLDWYINPITGFPIPERDGVVRYFYINGEKIEDVIFGATKEEVYSQCAPKINAVLKKLNERGEFFTYKDLIKSTTFYGGSLDMNKELLSKNPGYIASVAAMGEKQSAANLQGCWNIDTDDDSEAPIPFHKAREIKLADPQINGDRWITADLADTGKDNFVALVWDGFHIIDIVVLGHSTPQQNANTLQILAARYNIPDTHIIFDGNNGAYINDYIPDAIPFISYSKTRGVYFRAFCTLKDECYDRVVYHVNEKGISFSDKVASKMYTHEKMKDEITIFDEFVEECSVVRFNEQGTGRKRLATKKEMNQMLGRGRSMDVLDPIAMRFLPVLQYQMGDELEKTSIKRNDRKIGETNLEIYNDSFWA